MSFQDAVLTGQAPDGGLLLPETLPDVSAKLDGWRDLSYPELAVEVMSLFIDDIDDADLARMVNAAYSTFRDADVTPIVSFGSLHVMELFHGPTLAFKDIALQFLGQVFEYVLAERGGRLNILGSTSGDTGSAAIAGVRGRDNIDIFVLYPNGKTSELQELQMTTVTDSNVHCIAIEGSFDDCQRIMKSVFNDLPFKDKHHLGAVNSVNWARLLAQIVYYVFGVLKMGGQASFSVPTGNFGDIFAGYLALKMGVPIEKLVLATNENNILARFFDTGTYQRGQVHHTISPSMDIQVASNFERFLYLRFGCDAQRLNAFMHQFVETGRAAVDDGSPPDTHLAGTSVDTATTVATIARTYRDHGYLVDPHTAVGIAAAERFESEVPMVCLATAHPAKFPESVNEIAGADVARHRILDALKGAPSRRDVLPPDTEAVKRYLVERMH